MLPKTLALIDDDADFTDPFASFLREQGVAVSVFADSSDLLASESPFGYEFYIVDLMLPGVSGVQLIKILRLRSDCGILVISGQVAPEAFSDVLGAGADMYLAKPVQFEQVALAVAAVYRRARSDGKAAQGNWRLDRRQRELIAPDGARVPLSDSDLAVMDCFMQAQGETVTRETPRQRLGTADAGEADDNLNATIYRLRRRIERATPLMVPLQSKSRVGYTFRAALTLL